MTSPVAPRAIRVGGLDKLLKFRLGRDLALHVVAQTNGQLLGNRPHFTILPTLPPETLYS